MKINFIIKALDSKQFLKFANLDDQALKEYQATWIRAEAHPGYPCRVSLVDAAVGERVLLIAYPYHDTESPYRASGPIFIRENAETAKLEVNQVPEAFRHRLLSVRGYNGEGFMLAAGTVQGDALESLIEKQFLQADIEYLHIHNANPGCFSCVVYRA